MSTPLFFSIVVTVFNKEKDIYNTIQSVVNQNYIWFELIIVDDESTDDSRRIIESIKDERINYFQIRHSGVSYARNYGVAKAKYDFIAFLDGDDIWKTNHLEELYKLTQKYPNGKWFATAYETLFGNNQVQKMNVSLVKNNTDQLSGMYNYFRYSLSDSMAMTSAVCMKKEFFNNLGGFELDYDSGQDIDLWIKAGIRSDLCFSFKVTVVYNALGSNRITDKCNEGKRFCTYGDYGAEHNNIDLKRFLNFYRYWHILKFKTTGMDNIVYIYKDRLDISMLTNKQKVLVVLPSYILKFMLKTKFLLEKAGIFFRISN